MDESTLERIQSAQAGFNTGRLSIFMSWFRRCSQKGCVSSQANLGLANRELGICEKMRGRN